MCVPYMEAGPGIALHISAYSCVTAMDMRAVITAVKCTTIVYCAIHQWTNNPPEILTECLLKI